MWQLEKYKRPAWKWESKMNREEPKCRSETAKERKTIDRTPDGDDSGDKGNHGREKS